MLDALKRRSRFASPTPISKTVLVPEDEVVFDALKRHFLLPTPHLFRFSKKKNYRAFQYRLRDLYHAGHLSRPEEQFNNKNANYQHCVYSLPGATKRGWFVHKLMGACIRSSIELNLEGIEYIPLGTAKLEFNGGFVYPDGLFILKYPDGQRAFAFEDDRATEDTRTIEEKLENYKTVLKERLYTQWGVKGLMVLFATTTEARKKLLLSLFDDSRFLVKVFPDFGKYWKVPDVYQDVFEWESVKGPFDIRT